MKSIYKPKGKAGEYAKFAVNFYNGCSNGCEYCYLKRGVLAHSLGSDKPTLQKKYLDEKDALDTFMCDIMLKSNLAVLRKHGLFFTFSSDPLLDETWKLNIDAANMAIAEGIPCTLLTKRAEWKRIYSHISTPHRHLVAVGFTLTGYDELEPHASTNAERIEAMRILHGHGFKTWASIEPIIEPERSLGMIQQTSDFCDLYKVGLRSGVSKNYYSKSMLQWMLREMAKVKAPIYLKDSFVEFIGLDRNTLVDVCASVEHGMFVGSDYSLFNQDNA